MTYIQKYYGIDAKTEQQMINDGVLDGAINNYHEIYTFFNDMAAAYKKAGMEQPMSTAIEHTCEMNRISRSTLYNIRKLFD